MYFRRLAREPEIPFEENILYQDEHLLVADKPHFLPVTPGGRYLQESVLVRLKRATGVPTLVPMHRLDLETAGVLVFVVQPESRHAYHEVLKNRRAHKVYEAVAPWREDLTFPLRCQHHLQERAGDAFMQMEVLEGPANADTTVELLSLLGPDTRGRPWAHYRLTPHTGRKHQLRAQMNALGLPIWGDRIYPVLQPARPAHEPPDYSSPLQLLARSIEFEDPVVGVSRRFVSGRQLSLTVGSLASVASPTI